MLFRSKRRQTIANSWIESRCGWTPYDGTAFTGWPICTIIRGLPVMWDGELTGPAQGRPIKFVEALEASP